MSKDCSNHVEATGKGIWLTHFRVFSIQIQLYAYPSFWAWGKGSLLWARFSSGRENTAPYPREVNLLWLQSPYRDKCHQQPLNSIALHSIHFTTNIYIHEITSAI